MRACPFCNSGEGWVKETSYSEPIKYRVECNICGAIGPEAKTDEMAEKKWDGLLAQIENPEKFEEALEEEMGGVSAPAATLVNTPGVGSATPASTAAMTGAQQTSSSSLGSGDKWGDGSIYDQNGKLKNKKKKKKKSKKKVNESGNPRNWFKLDFNGAKTIEEFKELVKKEIKDDFVISKKELDVMSDKELYNVWKEVISYNFASPSWNRYEWEELDEYDPFAEDEEIYEGNMNPYNKGKLVREHL